METISSFKTNQPIFYLVATPIGNLDDFSFRAVKILQDVSIIACEDTRVSGKLLKAYQISKPLFACHEHNEEETGEKIVNFLKKGESVAYLSDAGYPLVSDPGARVVRKVIEQGFPVSTIGGSSAFLNALTASGLPADHFCFYGFLPTKTKERDEVLTTLNHFPYTLIFYEAPHRIEETLRALAKVWPHRRFVIGRELTKIHEEMIRGTLNEIDLLNFAKLRGEMVLLVEGAVTTKAEYDTEKLQSALADLIAEGLSLKNACAILSKLTGVKKNELYQLHLKQK
ncbi:MAG: 16S rRNA (cytidine(1402)-2'-O)-methyltransferase [Bacilli bacterium]|jgi:16S rRNA (cytidine1402-2'-O)-methyltransferase